jgi:hypothetical protein
MYASIRRHSLTAAALSAALVGGVARADDELPVVGVDGRPIALAKSSTELHRADVASLDGRNLPGYRSDLSAVEVQHWVNNGRAGIGAGVGGVTLVERPTGVVPGRFSDSGAALSARSGTTLMFGLRYRTTQDSSVYASATHLSGLGLANDDRVVSKVGVEFKAARSNFMIDYGGLGMHFAGDTRMTVKLRRSGVAIGMRRSF